MRTVSATSAWLVAPSSTIIQPSPVHTGLTDNPPGTLERLFTALAGSTASADHPTD